MRLLFWRRPALPAALRPQLDRDERVLAWAAPSRPPGTALVATNTGLWLPAADGTQRIGWHEIHKATWSGRELAVVPAGTVAALDGYDVVADLPVRSHVLPDPGELPHQVRARVTKSVAYTAHHPLPGRGGARVVARRVPGQDGLRWTVRYDNGADLDDPVVREVTAELVGQAIAGLGG